MEAAVAAALSYLAICVEQFARATLARSQRITKLKAVVVGEQSVSEHGHNSPATAWVCSVVPDTMLVMIQTVSYWRAGL
ncbi:hypothetical protein E2C01_020284 [Portunus trituberculatus]|uniref:Uncharacterized protein n=1 Tax=Portunus trituberculatus TaxID=210409 RepID=A0A5B7DZD0_PORTR|nr:hypothetical protein [Portunus trituberculatus]